MAGVDVLHLIFIQFRYIYILQQSFFLMEPHKEYVLSVYALIRDETNKYLFIRRSSASSVNAGRWDLPGGKMDAGETLEKALRSEVREETNLEIDLIDVAGTGTFETSQKRVAILIMECEVNSAHVILNIEHTDYLWLEPSEILQMDVSDHLKQFISEYLLHSGPKSKIT